MASIVRRRGAKVWTAFFRDVHRRQHCRSTGATDKKAAQKIADAYEAAASAKQTLRQVARVLDDMRALVGGERTAPVSLRSYATTWLEGKRVETKTATCRFYSVSCGKLLTYLGEAADNDIALVTKPVLSGYRSHLLTAVSGRTVNHHLVVVRMLFRSAKREGVIIDDPSEFVGSVRGDPSPQTTPRRAFTVPELEAVLNVADPEWASMILFGVYSALRLMDVARLTWTNIDLTRNELRVTTAKTGKAIILPLAAPLRAHIESLPSTDDLATPIHPRAAQVLNGAILSAQFGRLLMHAGLREPKAANPPARTSARKPPHELSFHSLRHTTVSLLHASGVSQAVSETFAGHSSGAVHELYIHADREGLQRAADLLPTVRRAKA
jgi:integrase